MPRYLVERNFAIPVTDAGAQACQRVATTNAEDGVTWIHSYATPDRQKTYCIYDAPTPEAARRVADRYTLMGRLFHHTLSPNRYGIPAFYALHVWAWRDNPPGVYVDWNPRVSCAEHSPTAPRP